VDQANAGPQVASDRTPKKDEALTEIVVTGTHIRGAAPVGSPVTVYNREDIEQSGAASMDQFARQMPENFSSTDNVANHVSQANSGRFGQSSLDNAFGGSSFDLHGLGSTSTLTLLNGHRLAPAGLTGLLTDSSLIPLSAIDRIEVLSDPDPVSRRYRSERYALAGDMLSLSGGVLLAASDILPRY